MVTRTHLWKGSTLTIGVLILLFVDGHSDGSGWVDGAGYHLVLILLFVDGHSDSNGDKTTAHDIVS